MAVVTMADPMATEVILPMAMHLHQ
jgi:hypothetical protein